MHDENFGGDCDVDMSSTGASAPGVSAGGSDRATGVSAGATFHGGDLQAQALVCDAQALGRQMRFEPNFFGHSQLDALMGL